ncbi:DUF805 domain-containing protein [Erythrobacter sp. NE805]|uniref:DUF805 domain-containing protein n=1 Tax=Erythrobacter sp. NE805 TaxID=3389875 RepID=UPI00396AFDD7
MEWMILPFKRYADFAGRSRRREFWMFSLLNAILASILAGPFLVGVIGAGLLAAGNPGAGDEAFETMMSGGFGLAFIGLGLYGLYTLAAFIPSIAVAVRRLHDRDMSGWWYLGLIVASMLPFVGFLASIAMLVLFVLPGTEGDNRFGPDPKNPMGEDVFA